MTSDFAPELAKYPKGAANPKIVQNSVPAYCLALLSDAACFYRNLTDVALKGARTRASTHRGM